MAENTGEVAIGAVVLAAAVGFVIYIGQSAGLSVSGGTYDLRASFRSVEGVAVGTDVRLAGVKVGTVSKLTLNPATYFADAVVSLSETIVLPDDSVILVSSEGLMGGNFIEIIPGGSLINLEPGEEIEDTQGAVSVVSLLMKFASGSGGDAAPAPGDAPGDASGDASGDAPVADEAGTGP